MKIGIIGCGNISSIYLEKARTFEILEVVGCADLMFDRAQYQAVKYGIRAYEVDQLFDDPEIGIIVNLTTPDAHASIAKRALLAGKSVYNEKPLAISREDASELLMIASERKLLVGCAPDTFLGGGLQTCRDVIDRGEIGFPVAATAFMACHGHESWHPSPEFYYQVGGGPLFDMGPYYLTALVHLLGPIQRVNGFAKITFPERTVTSKEKYGKRVIVEVPTHVAGTLEFADHTISSIIMSFDVWQHSLPKIEIYGSEGSLRVPDPNTFGGTVEIWKPGSDGWQIVPTTHGYLENTRSLGVADMAHAIRSGRQHRANGSLGYHVLDVMHALHESTELGKFIEIKSSVNRPDPLPRDLDPGVLDD